jgi:hypothetical protein
MSKEETLPALMEINPVLILQDAATEIPACQAQRPKLFSRPRDICVRGGILLPMTETPKAERSRVGLCMDCKHMRPIRSDRGSTFFLCERSATQPDFPKYPRLPVLQCSGYEKMPGGRRGIC